MRHALLPLFLATPASAQSVADFGGTGCRLIPVEGQSQVADVICHNAVTSGEAWSEGAMVAGGLVVGLTISHGPGDVPDIFTIIPPEGYVADPPVMVLDEHARGVAVIREWVGM